MNARFSLVLGLLLLAFAPLPVHAAELEAAPEGSFTIAVIPDTQDYKGKGTKSTPTSEGPLTNQVL